MNTASISYTKLQVTQYMDNCNLQRIREGRTKNKFEEIMAVPPPNLMETTNTQIQDVQQTLSTGNIKKDTMAHYNQFARKQW